MNKNPPAFPGYGSEKIGTKDSDWEDIDYPGMTLLDWFAGQVVSGIYASYRYKTSEGFTYEQAASWSYKAAKAMITERQKILDGNGDDNE